MRSIRFFTNLRYTAGKIVSTFGHLSGIIHNAGIINPIGNMLDVEREGLGANNSG